MKYSKGFKSSIVRRVVEDRTKSVYQVAKETGISGTTIKSWLEMHKVGKLTLYYRYQVQNTHFEEKWANLATECMFVEHGYQLENPQKAPLSLAVRGNIVDPSVKTANQKK